MIFMDPFFLKDLTAYTAIVVVVVFIVVYSAMFDWHRHPMGRLMNFSLMSVAIVAAGIIIRNYSDSVGMLISAAGWGVFSLLLILRLRVLIASKSKTSKEEKRDHPEE